MVGPNSTSFEVQYGRFVLGYFENGRELDITSGHDSEDNPEGDFNTRWVVIFDPLQWSGETNPLSEAETTRVLANIEADMKKQGWSYIINWRNDCTKGMSYSAPAQARIEYSLESVKYCELNHEYSPEAGTYLERNRLLVLKSVCDREKNFRSISSRGPLRWLKPDGTSAAVKRQEIPAILETITKDMNKREWGYTIDGGTGGRLIDLLFKSFR